MFTAFKLQSACLVQICACLTTQVLEASGDTVATLESINGASVPANKSTVFTEGTYRLIYRATDSSGNSATCDIYLDVRGEGNNIFLFGSKLKMYNEDWFVRVVQCALGTV